VEDVDSPFPNVPRDTHGKAFFSCDNKLSFSFSSMLDRISPSFSFVLSITEYVGVTSTDSNAFLIL
jgi:hypothetical protein